MRELASHADVLRGSSRVPAPRTRDEPLRTSAWEAMRELTVLQLVAADRERETCKRKGDSLDDLLCQEMKEGSTISINKFTRALIQLCILRGCHFVTSHSHKMCSKILLSEAF